MTPEPIPYVDLVGAFGDIIWATHVNASPLDAPLVEVFGMADDHELILHRLLLAGYQQEGEPELERSVWLHPAGGQLLLIESSASWAGEALLAATRNRDTMGAPHLTAPFVILERLLRPEPDREELLQLIRNADSELAEVESTVARHASDRREILEAIFRQADRSGGESEFTRLP